MLQQIQPKHSSLKYGVILMIIMILFVIRGCFPDSLIAERRIVTAFHKLAYDDIEKKGWYTSSAIG